MRILVISDTHGKVGAIAKVIEKHSDINNIFFLGDLTRDIEAIKEEYKQKNYYIVSGNCDGFSFYKNTAFRTIHFTESFFTNISIKHSGSIVIISGVNGHSMR